MTNVRKIIDAHLSQRQRQINKTAERAEILVRIRGAGIAGGDVGAEGGEVDRKQYRHAAPRDAGKTLFRLRVDLAEFLFRPAGNVRGKRQRSLRPVNLAESDAGRLHFIGGSGGRDNQRDDADQDRKSQKYASRLTLDGTLQPDLIDKSWRDRD